MRGVDGLGERRYVTDDDAGTGSDGAQVAAEAMPYHSDRRTDCNTGRRDPGVAVRALLRSPSREVPPTSCDGSVGPIGDGRESQRRRPHEVPSPAWNTWSERPASRTSNGSSRSAAASSGRPRAAGSLEPADLLRQLVYLPQASIFVAEARREVVGGAVLALRPSVRAGGFVGTVDLLVVDPDDDADRVTDALMEEVLRSARNKGCSVVEAAPPGRPGGADPPGSVTDSSKPVRVLSPAWPRSEPPGDGAGTDTGPPSSAHRAAAPDQD